MYAEDKIINSVLCEHLLLICFSISSKIILIKECLHRCNFEYYDARRNEQFEISPAPGWKLGFTFSISSKISRFAAQKLIVDIRSDFCALQSEVLSIKASLHLAFHGFRVEIHFSKRVPSAPIPCLIARNASVETKCRCEKPPNLSL